MNLDDSYKTAGRHRIDRPAFLSANTATGSGADMHAARRPVPGLVHPSRTVQPIVQIAWEPPRNRPAVADSYPRRGIRNRANAGMRVKAVVL